MKDDPSYSPSESFEMDNRPDCVNCCDTGTFYNDNDIEEFCHCDNGHALEFNHDDDMENGLFEDDGDALSSAGFGTDEDYGYYGEDY